MEECIKEQILKILTENSNNYVSGAVLSDKYNISRTAIWKYVKELRKEGFIIESSSNKGYNLLKDQDRINIHAIKSGLANNIIGQEIIYYDDVKSTNDLGVDMALKGCSDGTVIIANKQYAGKGRLGRTWDSLADKGIWMSIILRPDIMPEEAQLITLATSNAVVGGIYITGISKDKIANILIVNKKVCGILARWCRN